MPAAIPRGRSTISRSRHSSSLIDAGVRTPQLTTAGDTLVAQPQGAPRRSSGTPIARQTVVVARNLPDDATVPMVKRPVPRRPRASAPLVHGDRYEIRDVIGRGGMGEVCSAYDRQKGREVASTRR